MRLPGRKVGIVAAVLAVSLSLAFFFRPSPLTVELGRVEKGGMQVTVEEQGETRSHDRFVLTAPVAGRLQRIALHDGDAVRVGQVVARIAPVPLSMRERDEQAARVAAAESRQREAEELVRHAQEDLAQAKRESARVERLVKDGFMSGQAAEQAHNAEVTLSNEVEAARFRARSAAAEVALARTALVAVPGERGALFKLSSPVAGRILRINDPSERVVAAGEPLLTIGDLSKLEVVIGLLSSEATQVRPGMPVILDGWGGNEVLKAKVQRVEPYAYTKVSALGVEEKRTNVVADLVDAPGALGDGYRVNASIVVWAAEQVLKVPANALFRCGEAWCVFAVENGRARRRVVQVGHRNPQEAEVQAGLAAGEAVVRHPSSQIDEGMRVRTE